MNRSHRRCFRRGLAALAGVLALAASTAFAQSGANGTIRGKVTDQTAGALPGVTVTVTSPALIVPQLVSVTDAEGNYSIPNLPIGDYRVVYDLAGFQRLVREEIHISAGFSATVNVTMRVGALEESVTVSGQSPVVDTTSTTPRLGLSSQVLIEVIPATRNLQEFLATTPGVMPGRRADLGGGSNAGGDFGGAYGVSGQTTNLIDGVNTRQGSGGGQSQGMGPDLSSLEELQVVSVAGSADQALPGVYVNMIVKSGGNDFHGRYELQGVNKRFQSNNLTPALRAQGVSVGDSILASAETTGDLGGRLIRDKLWFYVAGRYQYSNRTYTGFAKAPGTDGVYGTTDDEPGPRLGYLNNETVKVTYQPAQKYKVIGFYTRNGEKFPSGINPNRLTPFEATSVFIWNPYQFKGELQAAPSNRFLFNFLVGRQYYQTNYRGQEGYEHLPASFDNVSRLNTGISLNNVKRPRESWQPEGSLSYFPAGTFLGRHELKAGFSLYHQYQGDVTLNGLHGNYRLVFDTINGQTHQPFQINVYNYPVNPRNYLNESGLYGQDTWRLNERFTLNLGLRLDTFHAWVPAQTREAGQFAPAASFAKVEAGTWREVAPRFGIVYDVAGTGKTVLKATFGLYHHTPSDSFAAAYNQNAPSTTTYRWRDLNGNGDYDTDEVNLDTNGPDFVSISAAANNIINPNLKDPTTRQGSVSLERELRANLGARISYYYVRQTLLYQDVNVLRPYSAYTVALPRQDPGPDGVAGTTDDGGMLTVYDYDAAYRGSRFVGNMRTNASSDRDPVTKTIEGVVTRRTTGKWGMLASFAAQKSHRYLVQIPLSPNDEYFNLDTTWDWQGRVTANYELPWQLDLSGSYVIYSGIKGRRTYQFRNIPSATTVTLPLEPFGAQQGPVRPLWNMRVARDVNGVGKGRLRFTADILNVLNSAAPWAIDNTSGPTFGQYSSIESPRIMRGSVSFTF